MNKKIIKQLESLPFFTMTAFSAFEEIKPKALYQNVQRWVRSGDIIRLKNGLFVTKTFVDRFMRDPAYVELVANKLASPSYLSLEYVLQKNGLLTDASFAITSVTLKTTRRYRNNLGFFVYRHLDPKLYFGFKQRRYGQNILYEATLAKALFDFLYLRQAALDPGDGSTLGSLRINWSELGRPSLDELREIILKSGVKKMKSMIPILQEAYHGNLDR